MKTFEAKLIIRVPRDVVEDDVRRELETASFMMNRILGAKVRVAGLHECEFEVRTAKDEVVDTFPTRAGAFDYKERGERCGEPRDDELPFKVVRVSKSR